MAKIHVIGTGGRVTGDGSTPAAALTLPVGTALMGAGDTLVLLPGSTFELDDGIDLSALSDVAVIGEGFVVLDGREEIDTALKIGTRSTATGVRFKNCLCPVEIVDGADQAMVYNCFDFETSKLVGGRSFQAGHCTNSVFKNLTCYRSSEGISVVKGISLENCLSVAPLAFTGAVVDRFSTDAWVRPSAPIAGQVALLGTNFLEGENSLYLVATNTGGVDTRANFRRILPAGQHYDLSGADTLYLLIYGGIGTGLVAQADALRVVLVSSTGSATFDFPHTEYVDGFFRLAMVPLAPSSQVGTLNIADVNEIDIQPLIAPGGNVALHLDHAYLLDSSVQIGANGVPNPATGDPMSLFRGSEGLDVTATPPPFQNPGLELFQYDRFSPDNLAYITGGVHNFLLGAAFQAALAFSPGGAGHINLATHRLYGAWENDETFYDTELGEPGPDGEGWSAPLDETGAVVTAINADTVNLGTSGAPGKVRDYDDLTAHTFDKAAGVETTVGVRSTFAAPVNAGSSLGIAVEFEIPVGVLAEVTTDGLEIVAESAGGTVTGRKPLEDLVEGWNEVVVLFASPIASTGAFDPMAILSGVARLNVNAGVALAGMTVDHYSIVLAEGQSTAPVLVSGAGVVIDLINHPEGDVGRVISDPVPVRNAGGFLAALWAAIESADAGAFINRRPLKQQLATRTIEVRYSEMKFQKYGPLQGVLAQDWVPISRTTPRSIPQVPLLWVQNRNTLRNRTNEVG